MTPNLSVGYTDSVRNRDIEDRMHWKNQRAGVLSDVFLLGIKGEVSFLKVFEISRKCCLGELGRDSVMHIWWQCKLQVGVTEWSEQGTETGIFKGVKGTWKEIHEWSVMYLPLLLPTRALQAITYSYRSCGGEFCRHLL